MIVWLLKTLEKNPASVFRKKDLIRKSESQFERLKHLGLLAFCQPDLYHETYPCAHPCSNACPMDVVNMEGQLFAICPEDSEVDPIPLARDDISRYQFSLDVLIKAIREANDFAGDSYTFSARMYFIGVQVVEQVNTAFILALFPDAETAEPHLLSLPTRIAANYQRVVVVTPSLGLTQEPIYAKLRTASIFPVTLPSSFGQDNYKINYVAALRMLLPALDSHSEHMTVGELAKHFQIENKEALRKRLERFRKANAMNANAFIESQDRGPRKAKFLYNVEMVRTIVQDLKKKETSGKRPAEIKQKKS